MDMFRKPEFFIVAIIVIVLIGYIAYDYRKHNAQLEKIKTIEEHLSATVRTVDAITQQTNHIHPMAQELVKLKERQERLEELEDKYEELVESLDEMTQSLKNQGMTVEVDFSEIGNKKSKKKSKKDKKKTKKTKKEASSSDEESSVDEDSENDRALARLSRIRDKKKEKK